MLFYKKSMTSKLITLFLIVSLIPIAIVGYFSYASGKSAIRKLLSESLTNIVQSREVTVIHYLLGKAGRTVDFASDGFIRDSVKKLHAGEEEGAVVEAYGTVLDALNRHLVKNKISLDGEIYGLNVIDMDGSVIASTKESEIGLRVSQEEYFKETKDLEYGNAYVSDVFISNNFDVESPSFVSSAPLTDKNTGEKLGILVNYYETKILNEITTEREGLGETGEIYIVNKKGFMITESRFINNAVLKQRVDTKPVRLFRAQQMTMTGIYKNYRGMPVVGSSMGDGIEEKFGLGWTILAEVDVNEAFGPTRILGLWIMLIAIPIAISVGVVAYFMARGTVGPIKRISENVVRIGDGDLTVDIPSYNRSDEIGVLAQAIQKMVVSLRGITQQVQEGANLLVTTASDLVVSVTQIATSSTETASAVSETTTTSEEVKQTSLVSSQKAQHVAESAQRVLLISQSGKKATEDTIQGMNRIKEQMESIAESIVRLSEQSQDIGEIIGTVNDLAEQSNLLAVNASIEAAKAGEHGKGFAVVAQEIKNLAQQSRQATTQIQTILNDVQKATSSAVMSTEQGSKAVEAGVRQSGQAGESIQILAKGIDEAAQAATQIVASSKQQLVGMDQIVSAMENIKQASNQNVDGTKQLENGARNLEDLGQKLKKLMAGYKV